MDIFFKGSDIVTRGRGLTFDDVLLVPRHSQIPSRKDTNLGARVSRNYTASIPILSANMDTVTGKEMACAMASLGGIGVLHRFMSPEEEAQEVAAVRSHLEAKEINLPVAASLGVKDEGRQRAHHLVEAGANILTLDIAHGDSVMLLELLAFLKKTYPHVDVIAGNTATAEGARRMIEAGADAIKVGIGPGSMCTTRMITGHGVPQLTALALCAVETKKAGVPLIADGGLRHSGDIVKALCAGASSVMLGGLLAGTTETPGEIRGGKKEYRGMASRAAQESWRGELPQGMACEGAQGMVPYKGPLSRIINELTGGIRSGMTYLGVDRTERMAEAAVFMEVTPSSLLENGPHALKM